jgi:hypothetical protein
MGWINRRQQERDHSGQRDTCAGCGHKGTDRDPLSLSDEGFRTHRRHFTDENSGYYGREQKR